jgi:uncharacterized RDD family membrane protein YckC
MTTAEGVSDPSGSAEATTFHSAWTDRTPHPWRRLGGRLIDGQIVGFFVGVALVLGGTSSTAIARQALAVIAPHAGGLLALYVRLGALSLIIGLSSVVFCALLIGLTGTSPGKWLFGVKVVGKEGRPIGVAKAFVRELWVLVIGMGFNIPLVTTVAIGISYATLVNRRMTAWDRAQRNVVVHRPFGVLQAILGFIGAAAIVGSLLYTELLSIAASEGVRL